MSTTKRIFCNCGIELRFAEDNSYGDIDIYHGAVLLCFLPGEMVRELSGEALAKKAMEKILVTIAEDQDVVPELRVCTSLCGVPWLEED